MSNYNWCHGPNCHTRETSSRIRGSGDNKVLRTRKVNIKHYWRSGTGSWQYFCDDTCMRDYLETHLQAIIAIAPRTKALETPIHDPKKTKHTHTFSWGDHSWTDTKIEVDETRSTNVG